MLLPMAAMAAITEGTINITVGGRTVAATALFDRGSRSATLGNGRNACVPHYVEGVVNIPGTCNLNGIDYAVNIGDYAFRLCTNITQVIIGEGSNIIGDCAFVGCSKLEKVILPSSMWDLGRGAFANLKSLRYMVLKRIINPTQWTYNDVFNFYGTKHSMKADAQKRILYVPARALDEYKNTNYGDSIGWKDAFARIYEITDGGVVAISNKAEFIAFRDKVNDGTAFEYYNGASSFELTADIEWDRLTDGNWTPIGTLDHPFDGSFDGNGHKISGLQNANSGALSPYTAKEAYVGLFGYVGSSVSIKNLTLANSSIKGNNNVGGIVGYVAYSSDTDPFVENCHVSANVLVKGGQYVGGIAGYNSEKIIGCTSDANVSGNEYVGGIVGENGGLVKNSLYLGKSVTATENSRVGAIAGYVSYGGSFTNNYHTLEGKGGEGNYTNMGGDTEGAEFAAPFSVEPAGIGTDETSYGTGDYVGITPYTNGLAYKGRYYYAGTLVEGYAAVQIFKDAEDKKHAIIDGEYDGPDAVNIEEDIDVTSVTFNREFTPNSGYATIMFPFNVNASSLTGVRSVIEFDGIKTDENDNKMVGMRYVWCNATLGEEEEKKHPDRNCNKYSGELKAYTPYMIEMESATLGIDADAGVTLVKWREFDENNKRVGDAPVGNWVFRGALQKKEWPKGTGIINEGRLWAFAAAERSGAKIGEFVQFGGNNWANPFRAYLVECKKSGEDSWDCQDDSEPQPKASQVSRYRFADALAPTDSAATDEPLVMRQAAASETASLNSMDIVIVYGDKDSDGDKERPTVIGRFNPATGEIRMLPRTKQTYDLKGRKVGNGKKAKGAYYNRR